MSDTKQSTEDLTILEQLNLDYNNADLDLRVCCAIAPGS